MSRTTDLAEWLGRYGLGQYTQIFDENHIELSVLPDLTDNDLKTLGVSLGHRKILLRAIGALTAADQSSGATTAVSNLGAEASSPSQNREAELRQITVMFCDLVGSTQLSEQLDPEDLQVLIDAYREVCSSAIRRYGGQVASFAGDGVMAFFGWPRAHEDAAVRALHAALETLSAVTNIPGPVRLASRVGICTGRVVVGQIGRGGPGEYDGGGGRNAQYCRASANARRAQHFGCFRIDETAHIGRLRFPRPRFPGTQRHNQTSSRVSCPFREA